MKELDFDELDRAVNSLMSNAPKTSNTADTEPAEKVVDISSSTPPTPQPSTPTPTVTQPVEPASTTPAPSPAASSTSLPSRRGGRFMDVVHPSSDMKKPEPVRPSRQGITIAPRPTFDAAKADAPAAEKELAELPSKNEEPAVDTSATSAPSPAEEHPAAKSEWPDPLDMAGYNHDKEETEVPAPEKEEPSVAPKEAPSSSMPLPDKPADAPLTSPFLPDTKVEKRPLGGVEPTPAPEVEAPDHTPVVTDDSPKTQNDPNDQLPALPKDVEPTLPEEYHSDLVEVESDTTASGVPKTEEGQVISGLPPEPPKEEEKSVSTGPTSIPQQYHEEPTSGDKGNGAIYDTDTYHQPLAHPAKKKPGWLWVVWIVVILLVGAGAGAALYFLHIF